MTRERVTSNPSFKIQTLMHWFSDANESWVPALVKTKQVSETCQCDPWKMILLCTCTYFIRMYRYLIKYNWENNAENSGINICLSLCQSVASQPLQSALRTGPCQTTRQNCQSGTRLQPHARKIRMRPKWEQIKQLSMCYI